MAVSAKHVGFVTCILAALATTASASTYQVNYFTNSGCTDYLVSFNPTPGKCYNYEYGGTRGAALVNYPSSYPSICAFYTEYNCKGSSDTQFEGGCSNDLSSYYSVLCGEYDPYPGV